MEKTSKKHHARGALQPGHKLHARTCDHCKKGTPCYWAAAANLVATVDWPWKGGEPPKQESPPSPPAYDPALAALVREAQALGVVSEIDSSDVKWLNPALNGPKMAVPLAESLRDAIAVDETGATAAAEAERVSQAFLRELQRAGASGMATGQAWSAAERAVFTEVKPRLVVDMSSVSDHMLHQDMQYTRLDTLLARARKGGYLMKLDLKKGFWQLLLSPRARAYTAFQLRMAEGGPVTTWVYDRAPMGAGYSPWVFSLFSAMVLSLVRPRLRPSTYIDVYADDFFWHSLSKKGAMEAQRALLQVLAEIGSADNEKKRTPAPTQREEVLGVEVSTAPPSVRMPPASQVKAASLLLVLHALAARDVPVPARAIASAAGRVVWMSCVDSAIPPRARALTRCLGSAHPHWYRCKTALFSWQSAGWGTRVAEEVAWLASHVTSKRLRGERLLTAPPDRKLFAASDASGKTNVVAIHTPTVAIRFHLVDCGNLALALLEFLAMPLLQAHFGRTLRKATVIHGSDALGTLYWAASGRARRDDANDLCIVRAAHEARRNLVVVGKWLSREHLYVPDRAAAKRWA